MPLLVMHSCFAANGAVAGEEVGPLAAAAFVDAVGRRAACR